MEIIQGLPSEYDVSDGIALHQSAIIEDGSILKAPVVIGPRCYVAAGAYLRGGGWLQGDCIIGPGSELKSSFMFSGSKLAHLNFVGDSIIGERVNLEAGSIIANYRNEWSNHDIKIRDDGRLFCIGIDKFGALVGDGARIGANSVIAPGALIEPDTVVGRLTLIDQCSALSA
jgi:NDP-sugar pyrophosphorylase family protein